MDLVIVFTYIYHNFSVIVLVTGIVPIPYRMQIGLFPIKKLLASSTIGLFKNWFAGGRRKGNKLLVPSARPRALHHHCWEEGSLLHPLHSQAACWSSVVLVVVPCGPCRLLVVGCWCSLKVWCAVVGSRWWVVVVLFLRWAPRCRCTSSPSKRRWPSTVVELWFFIPLILFFSLKHCAMIILCMCNLLTRSKLQHVRWWGRCPSLGCLRACELVGVSALC